MARKKLLARFELTGVACEVIELECRERNTMNGAAGWDIKKMLYLGRKECHPN